MMDPQKKRLKDIQAAFQVLATETLVTRVEIFGLRKTSWHIRLLQRLCEDALILQDDSIAPGSAAKYLALNGTWFKHMAENEIELATWYHSNPQVLGVANQSAPALETAPDVAHGASPNIQQQILDTLLLCAENLVFLRGEVSALNTRLDSLLGDK